MINGAFGVGKTSVSNALVKKIDNSMLFDPEEVGFMLRNILPQKLKEQEAKTGDFQDFTLWRQTTVQVARMLVENYRKHLIVPMTIHNVDYFQYIRDGLKGTDPHTYHFCLMASKETIHQRLRARGEQEGDWCFRQTDKYLTAYEEHDFGDYIQTETIPMKAVVDEIISRVYNDSL